MAKKSRYLGYVNGMNKTAVSKTQVKTESSIKDRLSAMKLKSKQLSKANKKNEEDK